MVDPRRALNTSPMPSGSLSRSLDISRTPTSELVTPNSDTLAHATPPSGVVPRAALGDVTGRPTNTIQEIAEEAAKGRFEKLTQSMYRAYPIERPYAQDFAQLVGDLATRMIKAVPDELSHVSPEDVIAHMVDDSAVNAFVLTSNSSSFSLYINRGLIQEFLSAPELSGNNPEQNICVDALAGVVAHEICHTNFRRKFDGQQNSMLQEEYCDILPAKMLERVGFKPEAMSKLCDLFARIGGRRRAFAVSHEEPHASPPIRKEVYEKGAWAQYERERRKHIIEGTGSPISALRDGWRDRLEGIVNASRDERIVTPIRHEVEQRGFRSADCDGKLEMLDQVMGEYRTLISDRSAGALSRELAEIAVEALSEAKGPVARYSQHPLCVKLSETLYNQAKVHESARAYQSICQALGVENFGAFAKADEIYLNLLRAHRKEQVVQELQRCEELLSYSVQPEIRDREWSSIILPRSRDYLARIFTKDDFDNLKQGQAIPFPVAAHLSLRRELLSAVHARGDRSDERSLNLISHFYERAGINFVRESLCGAGAQSGFHLWAICPAKKLLTGTECGTLQAFDIDDERGISPRYPARRQLSIGDPSVAFETERNYAEFIARRGAELLPEVERITGRREFLEFVFDNAHLIMPQVHPVGALSDELTTRSQLLARAVLNRLDYLARTDPVGTMRGTANSFLATFRPVLNANYLDVYSEYHRSVVGRGGDENLGVVGPRVDPRHPIVQAILDNTDGLLSAEQQIVSISALNGFNGHKTYIFGEPLLKAFQGAVGGADKLRDLLGVDLSRTPEQFIKGLVRITEGGAKLYTSELRDPADAVFELRARYIGEYLSLRSPDDFTVEQLHTLHDMCRYDSSSRAVAGTIRDVMTRRATAQDLSKLSTSEFLETYQRIVAMGITDRSVPVATMWQREAMRRWADISDVDARTAFVSALSFPRPFSCGDANKFGLEIGRYDEEAFSNIRHITSAYIPSVSDPRFERFVIDQLVDVLSTQVRLNTGQRYDNRTPEFLSHCKDLIDSLDKRGLPYSIRPRVLRGVADELLLQRQAAFLFRDNLTLQSTYQSRLTFANLMTATHQVGTATNTIVSEAHNQLIGLRDSSDKQLRESLFQFFLNRRPEGELTILADILLSKLNGRNRDDEGNLPQIFKTLGMVGVRGFSTPEEGEGQREIIEYNLRLLHQRFLELDVKAKGASLSLLAVDTSPTEESFQTFKSDVLLPRLLPKQGPYNELLITAINDYFEFYGNALHHKYMVACAILASGQEERSGVSELANVGLVAKNFLGSHGSAGYKLLQRIRNHPTTPQEIKDVLQNVLDETISLPRWTIHERIESLGPFGATQHWVGRAKAGSMCLSVPLKREDGTESFLSIIHPGAQVDSLYWLQNFTTMASNLSQIKPELGIIAPMAQQTRRLISNETDFAQSPKLQQEIAERGYTYSMELPQDRIMIRSSCAPLISSEAKPHPSDFMQNSGNKEAGRVRGRTLLEMVAEFREKSASGAWSKYQTERRFEILSAVAFSVIANEVQLAASGQGKDHDRHPGNYLVEVRRNPQRSLINVELHHFDFGCADLEPPRAGVQKELGATVERVLNQTSLFTMVFRPAKLMNRAMEALFEKGAYVPEVASIPLGFLAAMGANERVVVDGKERALLDGATLAQACKVGLESAKVPRELRIGLPKGIKGWLLKRAYHRIKTHGARFGYTTNS